MPRFQSFFQNAIYCDIRLYKSIISHSFWDTTHTTSLLGLCKNISHNNTNTSHSGQTSTSTQMLVRIVVSTAAVGESAPWQRFPKLQLQFEEDFSCKLEKSIWVSYGTKTKGYAVRALYHDCPFLAAGLLSVQIYTIHALLCPLETAEICKLIIRFYLAVN